jgi:hypothetical protein
VECDGKGLPTRLRGWPRPEAREPVSQARGPYQLSGEWWERDKHFALAGWDVRLRSGDCLRLCKAKGRWWLEGIYG